MKENVQHSVAKHARLYDKKHRQIEVGVVDEVLPSTLNKSVKNTTAMLTSRFYGHFFDNEKNGH